MLPITIVPNSCFSVLFVHTQHALKNNARIILDIDGDNKQPLEILGEWIPLKYKFEVKNGKSLTVEMKVFVTYRKENNIYKNGFLGASPCYEAFNDYSFLF